MDSQSLLKLEMDAIVDVGDDHDDVPDLMRQLIDLAPADSPCSPSAVTNYTVSEPPSPVFVSSTPAIDASNAIPDPIANLINPDVPVKTEQSLDNFDSLDWLTQTFNFGSLPAELSSVDAVNALLGDSDTTESLKQFGKYLLFLILNNCDFFVHFQA